MLIHDIETASAATDLTGCTAIITGGARGIGGAVSKLFAKQGANVLIADILEQKGRELAETFGPNAHFVNHDVTSERAWEELVAIALEKFGNVNSLVNCAGILITDSILSFDLEKFEKVMKVNLIGTFLGIKHAGSAMVKAGGGSIVNISSTEGLQGTNSMAAYASSKWAVRGLTKVAAMELGPSKIRVNSIHPGPVNTVMVNPGGLASSDIDLSLLDLMPIRRLADPIEIAHACLYLTSGASAFITGSELIIDGGLTTGMILNSRPGAPVETSSL